MPSENQPNEKKRFGISRFGAVIGSLLLIVGASGDHPSVQMVALALAFIIASAKAWSVVRGNDET